MEQGADRTGRLRAIMGRGLRALVWVLLVAAALTVILAGYRFRVFDVIPKWGPSVLWILIAAIAIAISGALVLRYAHRRVHASANAWKAEQLRYELTREAGIALLIAPVLVVLVDIVMTIHHETERAELVRDFQSSILPIQLENAVGEDVADEIERQVLVEPTQYLDYKIDGKLELRRDGRGQYVLGEVSSEVFVKTLRRKTEFKIQPKFEDVSPGRRIGFKSVRLAEIDPKTHQEQHGVVPLVTLDEEALQNMAVPTNPMRSTYQLRDTTLAAWLEPGRLYRYSLVRTFEEPITGDYKAYTRYPCAGLYAQMSYDTTQIMVEGQLLYLDGNGEWGRVFSPRAGVAAAEISGTVLPMQGIQFVWRPRTD